MLGTSLQISFARTRRCPQAGAQELAHLTVERKGQRTPDKGMGTL